MGNASARVTIDIRAQDLLQSGIRAGVIPTTFLQQLDLNNGTTDGKIDLIYGKSESGKAASSTTSYDLVGTSLTDSFGAAVSFAEVALIAIKNTRTTALAYLQVGPHATNGFGKFASSRGFWGATADVTNGSGNTIAPDSWLVLYNKDGVPCSGGASDILAVVTSAVSGDTNSWDILICGRSA